jgi:hypothetical protein
MGVPRVTKLTYTEQLKHPKWQKRRLQILEKTDFKCSLCGDGERTLHVHHKLYRSGAMPWEYEDNDLAVLCETCHQDETLVRAELAEWLAHLGSTDLHMVIGYAKSLYVNKAWDYEELRGKKIKLDNAEQAEALGKALGLRFMESMHILCTSKAFTTAQLQTLSVCCDRLEGRPLPPRGTSIEELVALSDTLPVPETDL